MSRLRRGEAGWLPGARLQGFRAGFPAAVFSSQESEAESAETTEESTENTEEGEIAEDRSSIWETFDRDPETGYYVDPDTGAKIDPESRTVIEGDVLPDFENGDAAQTPESN